MSYSDQLLAIRDNLTAELANETARRRALTEAGDPPPTTYSSGGKSFDWNGYVRAMIELIKKANEDYLASLGVNEAEIYGRL